MSTEAVMLCLLATYSRQPRTPSAAWPARGTACVLLQHLMNHLHARGDVEHPPFNEWQHESANFGKGSPLGVRDVIVRIPETCAYTYTFRVKLNG